MFTRTTFILVVMDASVFATPAALAQPIPPPIDLEHVINQYSGTNDAGTDQGLLELLANLGLKNIGKEGGSLFECEDDTGGANPEAHGGDYEIEAEGGGESLGEDEFCGDWGSRRR